MTSPYSTLPPSALNRAVAERLGWTDISPSGVFGSRDIGKAPGWKYKTEIGDYAGNLTLALGLVRTIAEVRLTRKGADSPWNCYLFDGAIERSAQNVDPAHAVTQAFMLWMDAKGEK